MAALADGDRDDRIDQLLTEPAHPAAGSLSTDGPISGLLEALADQPLPSLPDDDSLAGPGASNPFHGAADAETDAEADKHNPFLNGTL